MKTMILTLALLAALTLAAGEAGALTRPEIINRAREYRDISWSIADTAAALHDSPLHRYRETGQCDSQSPLAKWIQDYQGGNWHGTYFGAPYAYGGRQTPSQAADWVSGGVPHAIGLCDAQWYWRYERSKTPYCFAGSVDCVAVAGFATQWRDWRMFGTRAMLNDAQSSNGYYVQLCRGACQGTMHGYEQPVQGDLLVRPDQNAHVVVWVSGNWDGTSTIIHATGDPEHEGTVELEIPGRGYQHWVSDGYYAIAVRALHEDPKCGFRHVHSPAPGVVEWLTGWMHNTWGFAIAVSEDGETWEKVGDYLLAEEADSTEPRAWTWRGTLPASGLLRVVEIERGTGKQQHSLQTLDLGRLAGR